MILNEKDQKDSNFTCENYMKFRFQCSQINFYWNTAMLFPLYVVHGCFSMIMAELSNCVRDPQSLEYLLPGLFRKSLLTPAVNFSFFPFLPEKMLAFSTPFHKLETWSS